MTYYSSLGFLEKVGGLGFGVSTSYVTKTLNLVVPETGPDGGGTVKYAKIGFHGTFGGGGIIVVDEVVLNITGQSTQPEQEDEGRYRVSINFEGQTLKGYGNVHDVIPNSAPALVVLT